MYYEMHVVMAWYIIFAKTRHISIEVKGSGGSMS
jgi:hypothetical protein